MARTLPFSSENAVRGELLVCFGEEAVAGIESSVMQVTRSGGVATRSGIADFDATASTLKQRFNITLVKDNISALQALLKGRGEVAIINVSYLNQYLLAHPGTAEQLLISQKWDQHYQHRAILHPAAPITPAQLEQWLAALQQKGELDRLWTKYGAPIIAA